MYRLNTKKEEEKEVLSPDLDDTPPSDDVLEAEDQFGRMSFHPNTYGYAHGMGQREQGSLTGIAQRVMRPNMARSPASRTSYGFPDT